jgi:hypothetical protein
MYMQQDQKPANDNLTQQRWTLGEYLTAKPVFVDALAKGKPIRVFAANGVFHDVLPKWSDDCEAERLLKLADERLEGLIKRPLWD